MVTGLIHSTKIITKNLQLSLQRVTRLAINEVKINFGVFMNKKLALIVALFLAGCQSTKGKGHYTPGSQGDLEANAGDHVLFAFDSAMIDEDARSTLSKQAEWLKSNSNVNVVIEGHCDERGTREYNLALGAKRANSAREFLTSSGVPSSRMDSISYGKERPPVAGSGEEVWAQNRRAHTIVKN